MRPPRTAPNTVLAIWILLLLVLPGTYARPAGASQLASWWKAVAAADSARITRLGREVAAADDSSGDLEEHRTPVAGASATVGRAWIDEFTKLLSAAEGFEPGQLCAPAGRPTEPEAPILSIRFAAAGAVTLAPEVFVRLDENCLEFSEFGTLLGSEPIGSARTRLLALLRDALPADTVLAPAAVTVRAPTADTARVIVMPPPAAGMDGLPRLGEYVYVEELPEAIKKAAPEYPDEARKKGVDGTVLVQALVGKDGRVKDTFIVKSIPLLDRAALDAVIQWRFRPAAAKGKPIAVWVAIPVKFTLR